MGIPSLAIDAAVEEVAFLGIPANPSNVAWFQTGPAPGEPGDAVFDGHLDWYGVPCAIFCHLRDIKPGQPIVITGSSGDTLKFTVDQVDIVAASSTPPTWLYTNQGSPALTLITCEGVYNHASGYNERLLVHSVLNTPGS